MSKWPVLYDPPPDQHCDPIEPSCVFDPTSWDWDVDFGSVLRCKTHGFLAPPEIYEQAFAEDQDKADEYLRTHP